VEIPGVIGVTAVGNDRQVDKDNDPNDYLKSYYSSFGVGAVQVTAPGGDRRFGMTPEAPNGRVLSTWPAALAGDCAIGESDTGDVSEPTAFYCYLQGTSMASPHVAGVAALIISRFGDAKNPQNGKMRPDQVKAYIDQTADPQPCPTELPGAPTPGGRAYSSFLGANSGLPQTCQGGPGYNSWYGNGQVNAFAAVTKTSGNH
jgi:subtilisin family serine protease